MFVDNSMQKKVLTVGKETGVLEAKKLMSDNHIRHLPVIDESDKLVGIVTDRDIRSASPSIALDDYNSVEERKKLSALKVGDIMTENPLTVSPTDTLQDALLLIEGKRVGAFPVVDENGKLKGIISIRDLMRSFINVLGIGEPGTLLGILAEHKVGQMKKIVDAITEENISFGSILVAKHWEEDQRAVFPYLFTINVAHVKRKLEKIGFKLIDPMDWYLDRLPKK